MATRRRKKRPYMQYSKRFAVAALAIGVIAYLVAQWRIGASPDGQYKAFLGLLEYTFGVCTVYNGNSVSEKFFASKYHLFTQPTDEEDDTEETNG